MATNGAVNVQHNKGHNQPKESRDYRVRVEWDLAGVIITSDHYKLTAFGRNDREAWSCLRMAYGTKFGTMPDWLWQIWMTIR